MFKLHIRETRLTDLYEAGADYDDWLRETGNDPHAIFEEVIEESN